MKYEKGVIYTEHGTLRRYAHHGCRCALCTAANTAYANGYRYRRPDMIKRQNLYKYGLTFAAYQAMLAAQGGVCAACEQPETTSNQFGPNALAVDHDHETSKVRGLLCSRCNRSLGLLGDNVERLEKLAAYRRRFT